MTYKVTEEGNISTVFLNGEIDMDVTDKAKEVILPLVEAGKEVHLNLKDVSGALPVTFKLFSDKSLVFQGSVLSDDIFRLPSGYRSDTFEVAVSGSARIRAIHVGETPIGLKTV